MELRNHCAAVVTDDAESYPDFILGMAREHYPSFIKNRFNWGGENEVWHHQESVWECCERLSNDV